MQQFIQQINQQMELNSGKNLFARRDGLFRIMELPDDIMEKMKTISQSEETALLDMVTTKALEALYKLNQYYYFSSDNKQKLKSIYSDMLRFLKEHDGLSEYKESHYSKLRSWLAETNPFAPKLYDAKKETLQEVVCEEYNAQLQLDLLQVDINTIEEPVLDIGCGKNGALVDYLRKSGIEAFGFDRSIANTEFCKNADWFEYPYGIERWGTIISNLGFSNHFNHHHLRSDGNYVAYAEAYMQILYSLKPGGTFHYAPSLPFIERFLDRENFTVYTHKVFSTDYTTTHIRKNYT